ncbi:MAG: PilZ domain-containing protein [Candidatus Eremiobacteraeota bacterium]|nr:PilZ domain-containing protein [Candidatus Eremiobacteraeota bacterium]
MADTPPNGTTLTEADHKAVRLRAYIDLVVEDKLSFTLLRAVAADISSTGMRILCDQYLPPKTKYTFTMKQEPSVVTKGEIRWVRPSAPNMHQCGVLFIDLSQADRERLERFLIMERERAIIASSPAAAIRTAVRPAAARANEESAEAASL